MKKRAQKRYLNRKNIIISSVVGVALLTGGVSAYYVASTNVQPTVANVQTEVSPSPSAAPRVQPETEIEQTSTTTPTPSVSPTPALKTLDDLTIEQIETQSMQIKDCTTRATAKFGQWTDTQWDSMIRAEINKETGSTVFINSYNQSSHYGHKVCVYWYTLRDLTAN